MRNLLFVSLIATLAVFAVLQGSARSTEFAAALDVTPAATPSGADNGELADLRNRVNALSTQVAMLGGADAEGITGRLGGSRAGFDDLYGRPTAYLDADEVGYDVPGIGVVTAKFIDDHAVTLTISPTVQPGTPVNTNAAEWSSEQAKEIAERFLPDDAAVSENGTIGEGTAGFNGTSELLNVAMSAADPQGCAVPGALPFRVRMDQSDTSSVTSLTIESDAPGTGAALPLAPVEPEEGRLNQINSRAVANASLGGNVSVNGVEISATSARAGAQIGRQAAEGFQFFTVELALRNNSGDVLTVQPGDLLLVDRKQRESSALCSGAEPVIADVELAPGESLDGIVTFQIPERFRPERLVVLVNGAIVGFNLR
ncbi:MAG: DUF4352 domain-containing protein [Thermomicrobiales bacterium]